MRLRIIYPGGNIEVPLHTEPLNPPCLKIRHPEGIFFAPLSTRPSVIRVANYYIDMNFASQDTRMLEECLVTLLPLYDTSINDVMMSTYPKAYMSMEKAMADTCVVLIKALPKITTSDTICVPMHSQYLELTQRDQVSAVILSPLKIDIKEVME